MQYSQAQTQQRYDQWLKQTSQEVNRWKAVGILKGLQDDYHEKMVGLLLENQRLYQEEFFAQWKETDYVKSFRRTAFPLVRRVFGNTPLLDWVGFQVALGPNNILWLKRGQFISERDIVCKTRLLQTNWPLKKLMGDDPDRINTLDEEREVVRELAETLSDELCREVLNDLLVSVRKRDFSLDETDDQRPIIKSAIDWASVQIKDSCGHEPTWLVTSPAVVRLFESDQAYNFISIHESVVHGGVFFAGHMGDLNVYCDEQFPEDKVLLGYRGGWNDAGYYLMPYIPFAPGPVVLDPGSFNPRLNIVYRYAKTLVQDGPKFYYRLDLNNVVFPQKPDFVAKSGLLGLGTVVVLQKRELAMDSQDECAEQPGSGELVSESEHQPDDICADGDQGGVLATNPAVEGQDEIPSSDQPG